MNSLLATEPSTPVLKSEGMSLAICLNVLSIEGFLVWQVASCENLLCYRLSDHIVNLLDIGVSWVGFSWCGFRVFLTRSFPLPWKCPDLEFSPTWSFPDLEFLCDLELLQLGVSTTQSFCNLEFSQLGVSPTWSFQTWSFSATWSFCNLEFSRLRLSLRLGVFPTWSFSAIWSFCNLEFPRLGVFSTWSFSNSEASDPSETRAGRGRGVRVGLGQAVRSVEL